MRRLGFCDECVALVMSCAHSIVYSIYLNGNRGDNFCPSRGQNMATPLALIVFYYVQKDSHLFLN